MESKQLRGTYSQRRTSANFKQKRRTVGSRTHNMRCFSPRSSFQNVSKKIVWQSQWLWSHRNWRSTSNHCGPYSKFPLKQKTIGDPLFVFFFLSHSYSSDAGKKCFEPPPRAFHWLKRSTRFHSINVLSYNDSFFVLWSKLHKQEIIHKMCTQKITVFKPSLPPSDIEKKTLENVLSVCFRVNFLPAIHPYPCHRIVQAQPIFNNS